MSKNHPRGSSESKEDIAPGKGLQQPCLLLGGTLLMKKKGLKRKRKLYLDGKERDRF